MATIIKDAEFITIPRTVKPDAKKRITLPDILVKEGVIFAISHNSLGQILLDPQVIIPASELWVFKNKKILASIDKGMTESDNGQTIDSGSFAKYVKDDL
ncbi:MAG: hypothetical protein ABR886_03245 [Dehalococcoidales bacterium]|jgi:hypothetical protein